MAKTIDATTNRDQAINIRATRDQRDLIDQAARALGKSRTEFMLETAYREAENVLLDRVFFRLNSDTFDQFNEMLDHPADSSQALQTLLRTPAPWQ